MNITKEEFDKKRKDIKNQIATLDAESRQLHQDVLDQLTKESGLSIGQQVVWNSKKCWITGFVLDSWYFKLKVKLNKVKANGENGGQIANSYGVFTSEILELKGDK